MEKIAKMQISWRRAAEGIMLAVMAGCGIFLFALMSAEKSSSKMIFEVGFIGGIAGILSLISEIITVTKEQNRRMTLNQGQSALQRQSPEVPLDGCSWWFAAACFIITSSHTVLMVIYAITLKDWPWKVRHLGLAVLSTCMVFAVFLRPRDEEAGIKILHLHFFIFAIGSEAAVVVGDFRGGEGGNVGGCLGILRMVIFWPITYALGLKLRRNAVNLSPAELSKFLYNTVLLGGVGAMAPMIYFSFETLSCFVSKESLKSDQCHNTSRAAMFLSMYLVTITAVSIANKAVSREDRGKVLTYDNLSILRLKWKEKIQGVLAVVTVITSMFLFSVLGVQGDPSDTIWMVGAVGALTLLIAALIEFIDSIFVGSSGREQPARTCQALKRDLEGASNFMSHRRVSLGKVADDMTIAGIV